MTHAKRVFIFGAGFSKPARMPLATELLPLICEKLWDGETDEDMQEWLDGLQQRLAWLSRADQQADVSRLNIEGVFHYAPFDIEAYRLQQQLARVGRGDGPGTPWNTAETIETWLHYLERDLCDVILEEDSKADLDPITRWATTIGDNDSVMTFNYDTLVERALAGVGKAWNHAMPQEGGDGIAVCKLHGSIDWIVAHRSQRSPKLDLLFDKPNENGRDGQDTGHVEDDYCLWRCRTREQLQEWIPGRVLQNAPLKDVGIAGLGTYKPLHRIPGLVFSWTRGMSRLYEADLGVVVGFSMSDFDAMAQMQFAEVARRRSEEGRPLSIVVIDPSVDEAIERRFRRVFGEVRPARCCHEDFDWNTLSS